MRGVHSASVEPAYHDAMGPTATRVTPQPIRRPIRRLPALVANQIAAGEVVERPASVVKELVENSLDAGATRISVELDAGGADLIRVTDDGHGIEPDQLLLAIAEHATSKIEQAEDLTGVATLGFRGEALASIASVCRLQITTRTADAQTAWTIRAAGDDLTEPRPASGPPGTTIEARDLFFNTPARRAFLRATTAEQTHCVESIREIALAHPSVAFEVRTNGRVLLELPATDGPRRRVLDVLGRELEPQMLEVHADTQEGDQGAALWGLVGLPAIARANHKALRTLVNGRSVRDKTLQHAVREAYRGLIEPGRYPTAVLMIEMPPAGVDVNVHPAKAEVRFRDQGLVHSLVLRSVREALQRADLTPALASRPSARTFASGYEDFQLRQQSPGSAPTSLYASLAPAPSYPQHFEEGQHASDQYRAHTGSSTQMASGEHSPFGPASAGVPDQAANAPWTRPIQVHNAYIVAEDEQGLVIIDQHALHERVMFETLLERVATRPLESQRLITPVVVDAAPTKVSQIESLSPLLARIGLELAPLGARTVGIMAFPSLLFERGVDPAQFVEDLLDKAEGADFETGSEEALHEVLDMMACKAAVKAGDPLTREELDELLRFRGTVQRATSCPHGRTTTVRLTLRDLQRLFDRR